MKVKAAIAALCKLLAGFGVRPVPGAGEAAAIYPEIFRQAKFDRKEATAEFWKLLHWLLKLVNEDGPCEVIDLADQIEYVKAAVCYYGYGFMDFYQLPADGTWGSRDLLLAFSWLLQKIHLLEQLLNLQRLHVEDQVSLCTCRQAIPISPVERSDLRDGRHPAGMDVRYLQCLQGKLRFRWRSLYSAQQERCSALYKIHLYTRGCSSSQSIDHLSATETRLIQDPKQCGEFVQLLERENMRLEAYLEWKQLEPLYWQWMESVLAAKLQDTQELLNVKVRTVTGCSLDQRGNCSEPGNFRETGKLCSELLKLQSELQDQRTAKDERIKDQERGMGTHARQREAVFLTQCDVERKLGAVQARASHKSRGHSHVGLALRANSTPVRTKPPSAQQHNVSGSLTASEVITQLRAEATELKKELQELQQLSREALGEIVERLDRVICIPPMQR
ncbi:tubulin epsilon and delta complex protein 1 isoform X1 [Heterodontus francisci]|uniref:tubulin epsilon and delta complex protein 1 isoform X1 n=1 Tax=Heterodontus francisci TaxID=7792 RepID=UPI00355AF152